MESENIKSNGPVLLLFIQTFLMQAYYDCIQVLWIEYLLLFIGLSIYKEFQFSQ